MEKFKFLLLVCVLFHSLFVYKVTALWNYFFPPAKESGDYDIETRRYHAMKEGMYERYIFDIPTIQDPYIDMTQHLDQYHLYNLTLLDNLKLQSLGDCQLMTIPQLEDLIEHNKSTLLSDTCFNHIKLPVLKSIVPIHAEKLFSTKAALLLARWKDLNPKILAQLPFFHEHLLSDPQKASYCEIFFWGDFGHSTTLRQSSSKCLKQIFSSNKCKTLTEDFFNVGSYPLLPSYKPEHCFNATKEMISEHEPTSQLVIGSMELDCFDAFSNDTRVGLWKRYHPYFNPVIQTRYQKELARYIDHKQYSHIPLKATTGSASSSTAVFMLDSIFVTIATSIATMFIYVLL